MVERRGLGRSCGTEVRMKEEWDHADVHDAWRDGARTRMSLLTPANAHDTGSGDAGCLIKLTDAE